jgi:hypothetical protein
MGNTSFWGVQDIGMKTAMMKGEGYWDGDA